MPTVRPFAYNPSRTLISGTIQVGDLAVGTPTSGFTGPPQWWMGPDEDLGYVITESVSGGTQPTNIPGVTASVGFFRTEDFLESSFINLAQIISTNQTFISGNEASLWLNANGYWTSYSDVVTNGLTLQLDASNPTSYSGSGNVWYDLVAPQDNITLVNSPTFTAPSPSYFTFNGSNQYGVGTGPVLSSTSYTKSVWFYLNSYSDNNLVSSQDGGHFMYMASTNRIYCGHTDWPNYSVFPSNTTFALNTWYYVALTFNTTDGMKLYVNGVLDSTYTANKSPLVGNYSTNVGAFGTGNLLNGRIGRVFCYNTSLSDSEVLQNYNGTLPPFISVTPTPTATPTATPTPTPTTTPTPTPTATPTPTPSPTAVSGNTFSQAFTGGTAPSTAIEIAWNVFRTGLTGTYTQFVWSSTNGNSITVSDPTLVQSLATGLRTGSATAVTINSVSWRVGTGCGTPKIGGTAIEFSNIGSCSPSSTYALRPQINNANWGGTNQSTIGAPSQTITLTFS